MTVLIIVPLQKGLHPSPRLSQCTEALRETGSVLDRFELGLGISLVVRRVRPGKGLGHLQINEELDDGFGVHRWPSV